uniref:Venom peptide n=1 Tax=Mesocestoides corti TaxID=53468 RepID=A0A5K3G387_MESCO
MCVLMYFIALIGLAAAKVPSAEERDDILEMHTLIREQVTPTATNMRLLKYSKKMEKL